MEINWLAFIFSVLPHIARAIIDGSRAAGVDHDTVAKTISKTILYTLNGANPLPPPVVVK
jgi:hypothetical protein